MTRHRNRISAIGAAVALALIATGCIEWAAPTTNPLTLPTGAKIYSSNLLPGDIDGDGFDDLVGYAVAGSDRTSFVLWSNGDGTFVQEDLPAERWPLAVADFDGDGIDDVVLGGPGNPYATSSLPAVLHFGGPADDTRPRGLSSDDTVVLPDALRYSTGDFNGDGQVDLVRMEIQFGYYEIYTPQLNDGSASFTAAPELGVASGPINAGGGGYLKLQRDGIDVLFGNGLVSTDPEPWDGVAGAAVAIGDLDGDGSDDWAAVEDDKLVFYRWNGTTNVPFPPYQNPPITGSLAFIELRDLDGDEIVDLAFADDAGPQFHSGTNDGGFPYPASGDFAPSSRIVFADVDGDGLVDAVTVTADRKGIVVHGNISEPIEL